MYYIDEAIAYLQELKAKGEETVAWRVITKDDFDWNEDVRSLATELFGEDFDTWNANDEDEKDYNALRDELWDRMVADIDDSFGGHSDDAVSIAIEYAFGEIEKEEWSDKEYGVGKVMYDIKVKRLMRENDWDADTAKSMLAIS